MTRSLLPNIVLRAVWAAVIGAAVTGCLGGFVCLGLDAIAHAGFEVLNSRTYFYLSISQESLPRLKWFVAPIEMALAGSCFAVLLAISRPPEGGLLHLGKSAFFQPLLGLIVGGWLGCVASQVAILGLGLYHGYQFETPVPVTSLLFYLGPRATYLNQTPFWVASGIVLGVFLGAVFSYRNQPLP